MSDETDERGERSDGPPVRGAGGKSGGAPGADRTHGGGPSGPREPTTGALAARTDMLSEALDIVDAARERGVVLRLFGGLAVRTHCSELDFCDRDYSDIDMVGRRKQAKQIGALFEDLGYQENHEVRFATQNRQLQFYRECEHPDAAHHYFIHPDDHVDVFLDTFRMDHDIHLADRLEIERYTISLTDVLLTKLQVHNLNAKDLQDIVTLLKDIPLSDESAPGRIDAALIARLCAEDWGLHHDVMASLRTVDDGLDEQELDDRERTKVKAAVQELRQAIEDAPKTRRWKRRARKGERRPWATPVEEQGGEEHGPPLLDDPPSDDE